MPWIMASLAWATPVKVEVLGAHLDAYVNLLPTINALKLCHRYGPGPSVAITKLPNELVEYIADFLVFDERQRLLRVWTKDFRCFQQLCRPEDHLDAAQLEALLVKACAHEIPLSPSWLCGPPWTRWTAEDRVHAHLKENLDLWMEKHIDAMRRWTQQVGTPTADRRGIFSEHRGLIHSHFGLDVWISHVRLEEHTSDFHGDIEVFPPETTVAYLRLPGARKELLRWPLKDDERKDKQFFIESGYALPTIIPPPLTDVARVKFKRMMKKLGLRVWIADSQEDLTLSADEEKPVVAYEGSDAWPKLMMLVKSLLRSDEEI